jgi:photosystem II stability/assembly factor-like uncharacterized protein
VLNWQREPSRVHRPQRALQTGMGSSESLASVRPDFGRPWLPLIAATWLLAVPTVHADGGFPDSLGILLPSDQPERILASTNFGLVVSQDAGHSWQLICEAAIGPYPSLYQVGRAPQDRLFAVTASGLARSSDQGCSWQKASGPFDDTYVTDVFPDPSDASHVLLLAARPPTDTGRLALFESHDAGQTFGPALYGAADGLVLTGVEISRSDPKTVYLSMYDGQLHSFLLASSDGGKSWSQTALAAMLGAQLIRILAVDPQHPELVYLRSSAGTQDQLVRYDALRHQARVLLAPRGVMTAFLQRGDGTLLVGISDGRAFISHDAGKSFAAWPNAPHLRALAERGSQLYAVADDVLDGYAVAGSADAGGSWHALLKFDDLHALAACPGLASKCTGALTLLHKSLDIDGGLGIEPSTAVTAAHGAGGGCSVRRGRDGWVLSVLLLAAVGIRRRRYGRW